MHRNTYLFVGILAVLAALVVGVNIGKKIAPAPSVIPAGGSAQPTVTAAAAPQTYVDSVCGFSVQYGSGFSIQENASGSAVLTDPNDSGKSIVMTCQKDIPRPALTPDRIEQVTIRTTTGASVSAKIYHDSSSQNGTPMDAVIFTHPTSKLDIFLAGYGDASNSLLKTIQIIP